MSGSHSCNCMKNSRNNCVTSAHWTPFFKSAIWTSPVWISSTQHWNCISSVKLAKVINDPLLASDAGSISVLVLLDVSSAFDNVDHQILLERMENYVGISSMALQWFRSYLSDRWQFVHYDGLSSRSSTVKYHRVLSSALCYFLSTCCPQET